MIATHHGQYRVVDRGLATDLRYEWVEHVGDSTRTMCAFALFTDAVQMLAGYQARETAERTR